MLECSRHGRHAGVECPVCSTEAATMRAAQMAAAATAEQTERLAYEAQLAAERQVAAQQEVRRAIEEGIIANRELARDGWKLEVQSKVERSLELFKAGLLEEASALLGSALNQDPGNLHGHLLRSLMASDSEDYAAHDDHLIKAIRLLGASGAEGVRAYRNVVASVAASAPLKIRDLLTEKLIQYAAAHPFDETLLAQLGSKGWDDVIVKLVAYLRAETLSKNVLQLLVRHKCILSGRALAAKVLAASAVTKNAGQWIVGSLIAIELTKQHGVSDIQDVIPALRNWTTDEAANVFETFADNAPWYVEGVSANTVAYFHTLLAESYEPLRRSFFERIIRLATDHASRAATSVIALGCGFAFATYLVVGIIIGVIAVAAGGRQETGLMIGLLLSPVGGIIGAQRYAAYARKKRYDERYGYLYKRQVSIERIFGFTGAL